MTRFILPALASLLSAAALHAAPLISSNDRIALEQLKDANDAAWGRKDVSTIVRQYTPDGTLRVAPNVEMLAGELAVADFFRKSFGSRQGEFRHVTTLAQLDPLDENTVLSEADVRVEKRDADGTWTLARRFRTISVAVRVHGQWRLRSVRAIPVN